MPLDNFINRARELKSQGCSIKDIIQALIKYGATANEADLALKEVQKEERRQFNSNDF